MLGSSFETRPAFSVGALVYSWGDVIAAARHHCEWARLERHARRTVGRAAEIDHDSVTAAARDFRRERRLIARDDLERWLGHWGLTTADWLDFVRRSLVADGVAVEEDARPDDAAVAAATVVDAICTGLLVRFARRQAGDAALAAEAGCEERNPERVAALAERARLEAATPEAVERELLAHGLDWTRLDWQLLVLPDADTAREAAMCIRVDGESAAQVAEAAGIGRISRATLLEDVEPSLRPYLEAAVRDELVGPIEVESGFALIVVEERSPPDAADDELRRRAEGVLAERAAQRALHTWVEWKDSALE